MKPSVQFLYCLVFALFLSVSCQPGRPTHFVGFSQCIASDAWRQRMLHDMEVELTFHSDIAFLYRDADGSAEKQIAQIEELIDAGVDVLIVSPIEAEPLTHAVNKAIDKGIPVILVDRKTNSKNYTAFVGADNYAIGKLAGEKAVSFLNGRGRVLEILGLEGSTPAIERHQGFVDAIKGFPQIQIVKQISGRWLKQEARKQLEITGPPADSIDLVFAHNDVMALAAAQYYDSLHQTGIEFIGVDGLPGVGNGIEMVTKKILSATILYPTGGEEAIGLAADLLKGDTVQKELTLVSTLIDERNSRAMEQQSSKIVSQMNTISSLQTSTDQQLRIFQTQRSLIYILIASLVILLILSIQILRVNRVLKLQKATIESQKQDLETLNKTKDKFFNIVSHDLRSPLASLKAFSDLMIEHVENFTHEEIVSLNKKLRDSVDNTIKMTENLTTWARMQMKEFDVKVERVHAYQLVSSIYELYKPSAEQKKIDFSCDVTYDLYVFTDKNQLEFVIRNLVNNAIKFTMPEGFVKLGSSVLPSGDVEISVSDNGIGLSNDLKSKVFSIGKRSMPGTAGEKGTGLGLVLAHDFVRLSGGELLVEDRPGGGTVFKIRLKKAD